MGSQDFTDLVTWKRRPTLRSELIHYVLCFRTLYILVCLVMSQIYTWNPYILAPLPTQNTCENAL